MVLRDTPVRRSISRCAVPLLSSVSIVMRKYDFKTFTPSSPEMVREERTSRLQTPGFRRLFTCSGWGNLGWPQVGEFGWPPGTACPINSRAPWRSNCVSGSLVFLAKPNYRILLHGGVTPCWSLKPISTIEFQQVTPPSSTHIRTQDSVIAPLLREDPEKKGHCYG